MKRKSLVALAIGCALAGTVFAQSSSYYLRNGATSVSGTAVDNSLTPPATPTAGMLADQQLLAQIVSALATDPTLAGIQVDVRLEDGRVTLSGIARDVAQQQEARTVVGNIAGAANVVDRMTTGG
jgi:osmotically-inducible protein OsmY